MSDKFIELPIPSTLFPGQISGCGRLFLVRPPKFISDSDLLRNTGMLDRFIDIMSYGDVNNHMVSMGNPYDFMDIDKYMKIDPIFSRYRRIEVNHKVRPEDIHFPEDFKSRYKRMKKVEGYLTGVSSPLMRMYLEQDERIQYILDREANKRVSREPEDVIDEAARCGLVDLDQI